MLVSFSQSPGEASCCDDLSINDKKQFVVKYLLKMAALIGGGGGDRDVVSAVSKGGSCVVVCSIQCLFFSRI